jgi:opacity protein-like surface antigen
MNRTGLLATVAGIAIATTVLAPANAADILARPYQPVPPVMLYNWTGFYIGAHFGGAFGVEDESIPAGTFSTDPSGVVGGIQLGYNYQFSPNWLAGVEGELAWTSAVGNVTATVPGGGAPIGVTLSSNHNWYDTLAGRIGYIDGAWLFYAKLGFAWMNADYGITGLGIGGASFNTTRAGFVVGAGAEYAFNPNWSAKIEYDFLDFGTDNFGFAAAGGVPAGINTQVHEVKVGVNYHFTPGTLFGRF